MSLITEYPYQACTISIAFGIAVGILASVGADRESHIAVVRSNKLYETIVNSGAASREDFSAAAEGCVWNMARDLFEKDKEKLLNTLGGQPPKRPADSTTTRKQPKAEY